MEATALRLIAGIFQFPKPMLVAYREAIVNDQFGAELTVILATLAETGQYSVHGEQYKRVPAGYDAEHHRADLLRYSGLYVTRRKLGLTI